MFDDRISFVLTKCIMFSHVSKRFLPTIVINNAHGAQKVYGCAKCIAMHTHSSRQAPYYYYYCVFNRGSNYYNGKPTAKNPNCKNSPHSSTYNSVHATTMIFYFINVIGIIMLLMHVIAKNRFWNTQCNITHRNARSVQENSTAVRAQTSRLIFCYLIITFHCVRKG